MKDTKRKVACKARKAKAKIKAKVAKGKAKVRAKVGKTTAAIVILLAMIALAGCQNPAQRSITIRTEVYAYEGSTITFGGSGDVGAAAQSNETGGNDAGLTASPVTDVRPDIDVSVPVNKANTGTSGAAGGALETVLCAVADRAANAIKPSADGSASQCADGSCTNCATGVCEGCAYP